MSEAPLLAVTDLYRHFTVPGRRFWDRAAVHAVDGISFTVAHDRTFALVGESGCGKTTTGRLVLRLDRPTSGTVRFRGSDVHRLRGAELRRFRAATQAVFQSPWSSLDPRMRVGDSIAEPLVEHLRPSPRERDARVASLLDTVGIETSAARSYPHEFSGGQRQRIAIARALAASPQLIVLDEPVSALDVSIRAQMMNLLKDLQAERGMAYVLIAHDLATVRYLSDHVAVMYLGEIVEDGPAPNIFSEPFHPYTQALISAAAPAAPDEQVRPIVLSAELPSALDPPRGCRFVTRCPFAFERCTYDPPRLREVRPGHRAACHLYDRSHQPATPT